MTRIIGGTAGGRRLKTPTGDATRPTSDRVREALFSALESEFGSIRGLAFLDLFAGSGAVGLEALSRGASEATAVESDRRTAQLIAVNARETKLPLEVKTTTVDRFLAGRPKPFDVVFADPPYPLSEEALTAVLNLLAQGWVADSVVVIERSSRSPEPAWPDGWLLLRRRDYGETVLWYVRAG